MIKPVVAKDSAKVKPKITKRALIQLTVTGFQGAFPSQANLMSAIQQRATALGYNGVGTVSIDALSTDVSKIVNVAATDIEPVRLIGILDDVLKTFVPGGYDIELGDVVGPVSTKMHLKRVTRKQAKLSKQTLVTAAKSVEAKPAVKPVVATATAQPKVFKSVPFVGKRTNAFRKIARKYATRSVVPSETKFRSYNASGADGITPAFEALFVAKFLAAAYGFNSESAGNKVNVSGVGSTVADEDLDRLVAGISVVKIPGAKTEENFKIVEDWRIAHPGVYVDTTVDDGYYAVGLAESITDVPKLS